MLAKVGHGRLFIMREIATPSWLGIGKIIR